MFYKLFDIVTIGLPFGVFKVTSGLHYKLDLLVWWGILDIVMNCLNFLIYAIKQEKMLATCSLAQTGYLIGKASGLKIDLTEDTGESLDVLFSFCIISIVIGSGAITQFNEEMLRFWNISVILNVMGAGSIRVFQSIRNYQSDQEQRS